MTTTLHISIGDKLRLLDYLGADGELDEAAKHIGITRDQALAVVANHGWPDRSNLRWAAAKIREQLAATGVQTRTPPATSSGAPPAPTGKTATPAKPTGSLIDHGKASDFATTRRLADKIESLIADLAQRLREEDRTRVKREREKEAQAAAEAEVKRLEAELKAARSKLRGGRSRSPQPRTGQTAFDNARANQNEQLARLDATADDVRTWQREQGWRVSGGLFNQATLDAYEAAHRSPGDQ